jgi:tetratricopeptide (TPR) repeat protein
MKLRILIAGLLIGLAAFAAEAGGDLFQKATTQVRAGNLDEAIRLYQRVATEFASDRPLAAKALVAEAKCYEQQGQDKADKATKLYEQVERDYRDQLDPAAAASARLVVIRQSKLPAAATMTTENRPARRLRLLRPYRRSLRYFPGEPNRRAHAERSGGRR